MHENSGLVYERVLTEIHCIKYMYYDCQICPINTIFKISIKLFVLFYYFPIHYQSD